MIFSVLWTILLGIIGGIVSSFIVSRVFLIQNEYQQQLSFVGHIFRKINYISAYLQSAKAVFEVSYDQDIEIKREMQEKGYKTEMEYYYAHKDKDWIKKSDVLDLFKKEIESTAKTIISEIADSHVVDNKLTSLLHDIMKYAHEVSSEKELSFKCIGDFSEKEQSLHERYDKCLKASGKTLCVLILKDKLMIILFAFVAILLAGTIITGLLGV